MKRIIVHSEAELELWQAVEYYETKCVGLGLNFEREISLAFVDIQRTPNMWTTRKIWNKISFASPISICYLLSGTSRQYLGSGCSTHQPQALLLA